MSEANDGEGAYCGRRGGREIAHESQPCGGVPGDPCERPHGNNTHSPPSILQPLWHRNLLSVTRPLWTLRVARDSGASDLGQCSAALEAIAKSGRFPPWQKKLTARQSEGDPRRRLNVIRGYLQHGPITARRRYAALIAMQALGDRETKASSPLYSASLAWLAYV